MRELITSRGRNYAGSPGCFLKLSSSSLTTATETKADSLSVLLARARGIPCTFEDPASPRTKVFVAVQEAPSLYWCEAERCERCMHLLGDAASNALSFS